MCSNYLLPLDERILDRLKEFLTSGMCERCQMANVEGTMFRETPRTDRHVVFDEHGRVNGPVALWPAGAAGDAHNLTAPASSHGVRGLRRLSRSTAAAIRVPEQQCKHSPQCFCFCSLAQMAPSCPPAARAGRGVRPHQHAGD